LPTYLIISVPEGAGTEEDLRKLRKVLEKYPGNSRVLMTVSTGNGGRVRVALPKAITVEVSKRLISKIEALFGPEHVTYSALGLKS
jgi:hypothetical protein